MEDASDRSRISRKEEPTYVFSQFSEKTVIWRKIGPQGPNSQDSPMGILNKLEIDLFTKASAAAAKYC